MVSQHLIVIDLPPQSCRYKPFQSSLLVSFKLNLKWSVRLAEKDFILTDINFTHP